MSNRLLFVVSSLRKSGPVSVLYALCSELRGREITILMLRGDIAPSRKNEFEKLGISVTTLESISTHKFNITRDLLRYITSSGFSVVHSHGIRADLAVSRLRTGKFATVSTVHNNPYEFYELRYGKFRGLFLGFLHFLIWKKFGKVVACSSVVLTAIKGKVKNATQVNNGTVEAFSKREVEQISGPKDSKPVVITYVGSLNPGKNVSVMIQSFSKVKSNNVRLQIIGDGVERAQVEEEVRGDCRISYLGYKENPSPFLLKSDWFISASSSEGLPMSVLEAMDAGCNLLLSDIPAHRQFKEVNNKFNAVHFFSLVSTSDLTKKIESVADGRTKWKYGSHVAWEKNYSAQHMANGYVNVYSKLFREEG